MPAVVARSMPGMGRGAATPELLELLLDCLHHGRVAETSAALDALSSREWDILARTAIEHHLGPLLQYRLQRFMPGVAVPVEPAALLHRAYAGNRARNDALMVQLGTVLSALRRRGVNAIVLKGSYLAGAVYPDVALRVMGDIDLLVHPGCEHAAESALAEIGYGRRAVAGAEAWIDYAQHHHLPPFDIPGGVAVEVHHGISGPPGPALVDTQALRDRARVVRIGGFEVHALSAEDTLIHLCVHAARNHQFEIGPKHLYDIALVAGGADGTIDWQLLATLSAREGVSRYVYCALGVAERLLGAAIPDGALAAFYPISADAAMIDVGCALMRGAPDDLPAAISGLQRVTGWRAGCRLARDTLFPSTTVLARIYGIPASAVMLRAFYLIRPFDLAFRRGPEALAIALRTPRMRPALNRDWQRRAMQEWVSRETSRDVRERT